jgi:hypothetical protein
MRKGLFFLVVLTTVTLVALAPAPLAGEGPEGLWLVTPEEAAQPDAPAVTPPPIRLRGKTAPPSLGPKVEMVSPPDGKPAPPPIELLITFAPNQAPIDLASLKVKLVKLIKIDITDRLKPYLNDQGIHVKDAKMPSGKFRVQLTIADVKGNVTEGEAEIIIQ